MIRTSQILLAIALPRVRVHFMPFFLLALLVPASLAWAKPHKQPSWKQNVKAGVEVGFGIPYAWILGSMFANYRLDGKSVGECHASPNTRLGVVSGYSFSLGRDIKLGPEVGLAYGMTRKFKLPLLGLTIEERYLEIPIGIKVSFPTQLGTVRQGLTLGYEFDILLSSRMYAGLDNQRPGASSRYSEDLKETIPDLSKLTGSIFLDSTIDFPKGFCFIMRVKFPASEFLRALEKKDNDQNSSQDVDSLCMHLARIFCTSWIEFNLSVDFIKWL
jgi:hypothetical protein